MKDENLAIEDYGSTTANVVRELARGFGEHLNRTAEQVLSQVRATCERNIREAELIQARCREFGEEIQAQAEDIARSNEDIFGRVTSAAKQFTATMDKFSEAMRLSDARRTALPASNLSTEASDAALARIEDALLGIREPPA